MTDWTEPSRPGMICGSYEAEIRKYKKLIGKSGRIWLVAIQPNEADNVYVEGGPKSDGFAGRVITFELEDGTQLPLKGPWHANADALFDDTGYDCRDKHLTLGAIGLSREWRSERGCCGPVTITGLLYADGDWTLGPFNRIQQKAKEFANARGETVMMFSASQSGSSCYQVDPDSKIEPYDSAVS